MLKFQTKRQFAKLVGVASVITLLVAALSHTNFRSQAYTYDTSPNWDPVTHSWKLAGSWIDCNGSVDNDQAHHSFDMTDADPAHHMGMICNGDQEAWTFERGQIADVNTNHVDNVVKAQIINPVVGPPLAPTTDTTVQTATLPSTGSDLLAAAKTVPNITYPSSPDSNPFANQKLYINPNNDPANYVKTNSGSYNATLMNKIAQQPETFWLGGWNWNITGDVSAMMNNAGAQGALPVFVIYNIPGRDCGGYSQGGASDPSSYNSWIAQIASVIGNRKAVVIMEPDGLTLTDCLNSQQKSERFQMIKDAVVKFKSLGNTAVYLDAGHPNWLSASDMAGRLKQAGIAQADGFALNISNFYTTDQNASYGKQISDLIGGKHFLVDTGRNGNGSTPDSQWCNPSGRALGNRPTTNTGNSLIDAYLWVKGPGGSDGYCNGGPAAGQFWADYALGLAQRATW